MVIKGLLYLSAHPNVHLIRICTVWSCQMLIFSNWNKVFKRTWDFFGEFARHVNEQNQDARIYEQVNSIENINSQFKLT